MEIATINQHLMLILDFHYQVLVLFVSMVDKVPAVEKILPKIPNSLGKPNLNLI